MPESRIRSAILGLFQGAGENILEERVVDYIVSGLRSGRSLDDILKDEYVDGKISGYHLQHVLQNKEVLIAVEDNIKEAMKQIRQ